MKRHLQATAAHSEQAHRDPDLLHEPRNPQGFTFGQLHWLNTADAAIYARRPSRAAFRIWAKRHGIPILHGLVDRFDIDAVLERQRKAS